MNKDKFRELLAGKIDSLERWQQVCDAVDLRWTQAEEYITPANSPFAIHWGEHQYIGAFSGMKAEQRWYLVREAARQALDVYPTMTSVMVQVIATMRLGVYCIHISRDDPSMVAYTPSIEDGMRDKQVRLSFGKLLRKLVVLATDTHIQALEASHRSEMDPSFEVARTQEEIQRVYTQMRGDSGCMRYLPSNWDLPADLHPSAAYNYAGLGVAYHEVEGEIKSRALIFDNPDDPKDKRYIRIYGDIALKRKLELSGYKLGSLDGARLRAISLHELRPGRHSKHQYLAPYIDGPGGRQDHDAQWGYRIKGEDCIRVTTTDKAQRLQGLGYTVANLKRTDCIHTITEVDLDKLTFTCGLTGKAYNGLEEEACWVYHEGEVKRVAVTALPRGYRDYQAFTYVPTAEGDEDEFDRVNIWVHHEEIYSNKFFDDRWMHGGRVLDNPVNRKQVGCVLLEPTTYGENVWVHGSETVECEGTWYRRSDCMIVFDAEGTLAFMPAHKVEDLRKTKEYVAVAPKGSVKAISHVKNPQLVMTLGKRRCVSGWHDVLKLADGTWDYSQNVEYVRILGIEIPVSKKIIAGDRRAFRLSEEGTVEALKPYFHAADAERTPERKVDRLQRYLVDRLRTGIERRHFYLRGEMVCRGGIYDDRIGSFEEMRAAAVKLGQMSDEEIAEMLDESYIPLARAWQHHAALAFKLYDAKAATWAPAADAGQRTLDEQLVATAVHIRDERFAQAA